MIKRGMPPARHPASKAGTRARARGIDTCAPRVKTYVYARYKRQAEAWARAQGLRPRDFRAFGNNSRWRDGMKYQPTDRVVVLGEINTRADAIVVRAQRKAVNAPVIERVDLGVYASR